MWDRSLIRLFSAVVAIVSLLLGGAHPSLIAASEPGWTDLGLRQYPLVDNPYLPPAVERAALVTFYNNTGGPGWKSNSGWLVEENACSWYGVTCYLVDSVWHIAAVQLERNGLKGAIPSEVGDLRYVHQLSLSYNELTGPIPTEIGNLTSLYELWAVESQLSGPIPAELGKLTRLHDVRLWGNQLSGPIPAEFGKLTNLDVLYLAGNQLSGPIPAGLGNLTKLQVLDLGNNQLSGPIPAEFGNLTNLTLLNLYNNQIGGPIPAELGNLIHLQELHLGVNQLTGPIPSSLGNLAALQQLTMAHNSLTGPIPSELGRLTNLTELRLFENQLDGPIPAELGNLAHLEELYLGTNQLTGGIPISFGGLAALRVLRMGSNHLAGPIPPQLGNLRNLTLLNLAGNKGGWGPGLSDAIPTSLGSLSNLQALDLSGNSLSQQIPTALLNMPELTELRLADNELEGDLPAPGAAAAGEVSGAAGASKLAVLDVSYNKLTGIKLNWGTGIPARSVNLRGNEIKQSIPAALLKIPTLEFIDLGDNKLEGHIPDVAALVNLKILKLDHNNLTGGIPINIDALHNLELLNLSYNQLDRAMVLPLTSALPKLYSLDLSHNRIPSQIPGELRLLTGLKTLRLGSNLLEGPIPDLSRMQLIEELDLSYNYLTGGVPQYLSLLTNLKAISLNGNANLGGSIPSGIGALKNLEYLGLHDTGLGGIVPDSVTTLRKLRTLDLGGQNWVGGTFLKKIADLTALEYLDVEGTQTQQLNLRSSGGLARMEDIVKLKQLRVCRLANLITTSVTDGIGIPDAIGDLSHLEVLRATGGPLGGTISSAIGQLTNLRELVLQSNQLDGVIPESLSSLTSLRVLDLSSNSLVLPPGGLGGLTSLETLNLSSNNLETPDWAGNGVEVQDSAWIGNLHNLKYLDLHHTWLGTNHQGVSFLNGLVSLEYADLSNSLFDGALPPLAALTKLKYLDLNHNSLSAFPAHIGGPASLETLKLQQNDIQNTIPADIFKLYGLKVLNLKDNWRLTGGLPEGICQIDGLVTLSLEDDRKLEGAIPRCIMELRHLRAPDFMGTSLCAWRDLQFQTWVWFAGAQVGGLSPCPVASAAASVGPSGGTLSSPGDNTTYSFAPGTFGGTVAVASTAVVTVTHVPKNASAAPSTGALVGIRHFYDAYARDASGQYVQPVKPYTVTIQYGPLDLVASRAMEDTLALYRWNGTSWVREPTSRVDVAADTVTANPSRFSTWAVLGEKAPTRKRLPIVMRGNVE